MNADIFKFTNYQEYLDDCLSFQAWGRRGGKSELAKALKCQSSFISQVINKKAHLSLEHGLRVSQFLDLTDEEQRYLLLLIQYEKAGSTDLRRYFRREIDSVRREMTSIKAQLGVVETVSESCQATYYSMWWYAAIHILCAFEEVRSAKDISTRLNLGLSTVMSALDFLERNGLVQRSSDNSYAIKAERVHLPAESPLIARHHCNWRHKAAEIIQRSPAKNIHYSLVVGIDEDGAEKLKTYILDLLKTKEKIVSSSPAEKPYVFLVDFFELKE